MTFTRRQMIAAAAVLGTTACSRLGPSESFSAQKQAATGAFAHGVASGDPAHTSVVLWTRITPSALKPVRVEWEISTSEDFSQNFMSGEVITDSSRDFTVKVVPEGLSAGQNYVYRFRIGETVSVTGRTRTLPNGEIDQARFAVVSCANMQTGYFNVYDHIARQKNLDAVLHLGDYFYEYGIDGWGGLMEDESRVHEPAHELLSLFDYRTRHAQYRRDSALQSMTMAHPLIALWDDHEIANDSFKDGAQNHQADSEGAWADRKAAALQAYYEWMPVRDPKPGQAAESLLRSFSYGDLLTLVTLETRLMARSEPLNIDDYTQSFESLEDVERFKADILNVPGRQLMGDSQIDYVINALTQSKSQGQPWRLIGNQVLMGRLMTPDLTPHVTEEAILNLEADWPAVRDFVKSSVYGLPVYPDSWDGYPWARERFYDRLEAAGLTDLLVVTGDAHEYWINDLTQESGKNLGLELGVTSVTSPTLAAYFGDATADYSLLMTQSNADVRYYNALHRGYIDLTLTHKGGIASFMTVDTVLSLEYTANETARFSLAHKDGTVKARSPKGLNVKQRALFAGLG